MTFSRVLAGLLVLAFLVASWVYLYSFVTPSASEPSSRIGEGSETKGRFFTSPAAGSEGMCSGYAAVAVQANKTHGVSGQRGLLRKLLFARMEGLGEITDIKLGLVAGMDGEALIVVGHLGYAIVDVAERRIVRQVAFNRGESGGSSSRSFVRHVAIDADGDGDLEFLALPRSWVGSLSLYGADGKALWSYLPSGGDASAITLSSTVDVEGDGKIEVLVQYNATSAMDLVGHDGALLWSQVWERGVVGEGLWFLDLSGDGRKEAFYVDGVGVCARGLSGESEARRVKLPGNGYANYLAPIRALGRSPLTAFLVGQYTSSWPGGEQRFYRMDTQNFKIVGPVEWIAAQPLLALIPVPLGERQLYAHTASRKQQAVFVGYSATRLELMVVDVAGNVLYEDTIASPKGQKWLADGSVLSIAGDRFAGGSEEDAFLVAYGELIWQYTLLK